MTFLDPVFLVVGAALAALVVLASWSHARRRRRLAAFLGGKRAVERLSRGNLYRLRVERVVLLAIATLAVAGAAAEPQWERTDRPEPVRTVVVAIDVSASMQAFDVSPTRLARAAEVARELVDGLGRDRVGLLLFAGNAYPLAPPTYDHAALQYLLGGLVPTIASAHDPGSLLSVGIREAATLLAAEGEPDGERSMILIGDGDTEEPVGDILAEVSAAAAQGIRIHTIGVGTADGSGMMIPEAPYQLAGPVLDANGDPDTSKLDEPLLERMAESGGGRYVHADDDGGLGNLLGSLAPQGMAARSRSDVAFLLILGALVGLFVESLLDVRLRGWHSASVTRSTA